MSDRTASLPVPISRRTVLLCLSLIAVTLICHFPATRGRFVEWDDNIKITNNPALTPPTWSMVWRRWREPYLAMYTPLAQTAWSALAAMAWTPNPNDSSGVLQPVVFHWASLLLHTLSVVLIFALARQVVVSEYAAALGAIVFAIHPIQVEPVAWMSSLEDVVCQLMSVIALWQYLRFAKSGNGRVRRIHYAIALIAFVAALLSKPSAVTVPIMAWALDRWVAGRTTRSSVIALIPWVAIAIPIGLIAKHLQPGTEATAQVSSLLMRPIIAADTAAFYLRQVLWPLRFGIDYGRVPSGVHFNFSILAELLLLALVTVAVIFLGRTRRACIAGAVIALVGIAPVSGLVHFDFQIYSTVADRYFYPSMIGVSLFCAALFDGHRPAWLWASAVAIVMMLCVKTYDQSRVWLSDETLFDHALEVNDHSWGAHNNLSAAYRTNRQYALAIDHAEMALALRPHYPQAEFNLGNCLAILDRKQEAIAHFRAGLKLAPRNALAQRDLASLYAETGQLDSAIAHYKAALQIDPDTPRARDLLNRVEEFRRLHPLPNQPATSKISQ